MFLGDGFYEASGRGGGEPGSHRGWGWEAKTGGGGGGSLDYPFPPSPLKDVAALQRIHS